MTLADIDGDGNLDCLYAVSDTRPLQILWGDGTGGFEPAPLAVPALALDRHSDGGAVAAVDLDGDGVVDLAALDYAAARIYLWRGRGGRDFDDPLEIVVGNEPEGLVAADLDGDGRVDLAFGVTDPEWWGILEPSIFILWNSGTWDPADGPVGLAEVIRAPEKPTMLLVADLDQNGAPDILALSCKALHTFLNASCADTIQVTGADPPIGPRAGGTAVRIRGHGFAPGLRVRFGGEEAEEVVVRDARTIVAVTPPATKKATWTLPWAPPHSRMGSSIAIGAASRGSIRTGRPSRGAGASRSGARGSACPNP